MRSAENEAGKDGSMRHATTSVCAKGRMCVVVWGVCVVMCGVSYRMNEG